MAALALAYSTRGQTIPPLKDLYQMAVSTNPALRKSLVADQQVSDEASRDAAPKLERIPVILHIRHEQRSWRRL
jgi:hypothetical protein